MKSIARVVFGLLALVGGAAPVVAAPPELLPAREAFRVSAKLESREIAVRYRVAEGYYLYRDKLRFEVAPATAGKPRLPRGVVKRDEFFGRTETYRDEVVIRIPLRGRGPDRVTLTATSQGCADAGVCYPPRQDVLVLVAGASEVAPAAATQRPSGKTLLDALGGKP